MWLFHLPVKGLSCPSPGAHLRGCLMPGQCLSVPWCPAFPFLMPPHGAFCPAHAPCTSAESVAAQWGQGWALSHLAALEQLQLCLGWSPGVLPRTGSLGRLCQLHGSTQGLFCSRLLLIKVIDEGFFAQDGFEEMTLISVSITYKKSRVWWFFVSFLFDFFSLISDISVEQVQNFFFFFLFLKCGLIPWIKFQHYHTISHLSCVVLQWWILR